MKSPTSLTLLVRSSLGSILLLTSCVTSQVKQAVAEAQAAMVARNDGTLVTGKNGVTKGDEARETAIRQLEALRSEFPQDSIPIQANLRFRIAMVTTAGGTADDATTAWREVQRVSAGLTADQTALLGQQDQLVWFFAKETKSDRYTPETAGQFHPDDGDEALKAENAFRLIATNGKISGNLRLWGAYHRALVAYKSKATGLSEAAADLPEAAAELRAIDAVIPASPLDSRIGDLETLPGYPKPGDKTPATRS